jgi:hypothetical protein
MRNTTNRRMGMPMGIDSPPGGRWDMTVGSRMGEVVGGGGGRKINKQQLLQQRPFSGQSTPDLRDKDKTRVASWCCMPYFAEVLFIMHRVGTFTAQGANC